MTLCDRLVVTCFIRARLVLHIAIITYFDSEMPLNYTVVSPFNNPHPACKLRLIRHIADPGLSPLYLPGFCCFCTLFQNLKTPMGSFFPMGVCKALYSLFLNKLCRIAVAHSVLLGELGHGATFFHNSLVKVMYVRRNIDRIGVPRISRNLDLLIKNKLGIGTDSAHPDTSVKAFLVS